MEVTVPKGYEAQKMVVTYTKKDIVEHTDQYIYESPDGGQTVYQKKLGEAKRELVKEPKTQVCIKVPVDKDGKIIVPIDPRRKVGGSSLSPTPRDVGALRRHRLRRPQPLASLDQ